MQEGTWRVHTLSVGKPGQMETVHGLSSWLTSPTALCKLD